MKDFSPLFTFLVNNQTDLPFHIGGLIQPGRDKSFGINNQDALAIATGKRYIAGVVCDGCGGTTDADYNSASFNEVGAHVLSTIMINAIRDKISDADNPEELLTMVDKYARKRLLEVLKPLLAYKKSNKSTIEYIMFNMLTATVVGAVITEKFFILFNYGDGICGINSEISDLENFSGEYYSETLFTQRKRGHCFNIAAKGPMEGLDNAVIGTDGMMDFLDKPNNELVQFLKPSKDWTLAEGIDDTMEFAREFRVRVSTPFNRRRNLTSYDDRAVIIIRRI